LKLQFVTLFVLKQQVKTPAAACTGRSTGFLIIGNTRTWKKRRQWSSGGRKRQTQAYTM